MTNYDENEDPDFDEEMDDDYNPEEEEEESEPEPEPEPAPIARASTRRQIIIPEKKVGNYFTSTTKEGLDLFSSGCKLLDCVLGGGWALGRMSNIVGDKSSGKTLLAIEGCANFMQQYSDGKIMYLEAEAAFDENYAEAIGMPVESVEFIDYEDDNTVEFLFDHLSEVADEADEPTLYIVDSLDALSDRAEKSRKIDEGSYSLGKQKKMSELFRRLISKIKKSQIHLMIISQVRENIGVTFGEKYTRSGGKALDFYASQILWLAETGKIKKTVKGIERIIGINVKANCKKNKVGLPFRTCNYPVFFGYGIDDIEASLDFLTTCKELAPAASKLGYGSIDKVTPAVKTKIKREMEDPKRVAEMRKILDAHVMEVWEEVEEGFIPKASKY